ncbi:primosomal protein N' [Motiliproteus sediminis]|uniref:primosomal protein N' n=1 Tax=Motiliproteus sediminis TaxID=1468178 RepID=UPI001AEFB69B|nr:primosomal protein N' [Motiliproteus sediminis]
MSPAPAVLRMALPSPLRRCFDYLPPDGVAGECLRPGVRLRVPFGRREVVGVLLEVASKSELPLDKLRPALELIDEQPLLPAHLLELAQWAARYYQYPLGEALAVFLPTLLRQGESASYRAEQLWRVVAGFDADTLAGARRQRELVDALAGHPHGLSADAIKALGFAPGLLRAAEQSGAIERCWRESVPHGAPGADKLLHESPLTLNPEQQAALQAVTADGEAFRCILLQGVTGSGKTEVYLQAIAAVLAAGKQALVLVPEIGLTPQTVGRFKARFNVPVVAMHSGLNDRERLDAWLAGSRGEAGVLIGTRSAILTPLARPGLIVIDEEHDGSFKQQEGFRYSARDLAVMRARAEAVPLLLGSATPSLESLHNAWSGRYRWLRMEQRAGGARAPQFELLDVRNQPLVDGLSDVLVAQMKAHLARGEQVLVFLNRRGFAPTLMCHDCGWIADCPQCDAHMTLHRSPPQLHCHHCDYQAPVQFNCPQCQSRDISAVGAGTERTEDALTRLFPKVPVIRVDRDSTRRKGAMARIVEQIHASGPCLLVGTQMLAKGHHFPRVTLVAILDADAGLFSADFRGMEKMAQLVLQVAGRAGRADKPGRVIMQTHQCDHPNLRCLIEQGYTDFARLQLQERRAAGLPPFTHYALVRSEAVAQGRAETFLQYVRAIIEQWPLEGVTLLGPLPSPMEKRAGRFRAQLLLYADHRAPLHRLLHALALLLEQDKQAKKVRWSIDVDPYDLF